ncbi:MAG: succinate dehydrogenase assembly factor 2 [Gammaproteobacteria bacterium]|jgi:antitoxin CptB
MSETTDSNRNRLAWQCRRGMRELDEILGGFLETGYEQLDEPGRLHFSNLLEYPDSVLLEILMGRMTAADRDVAHIVRQIRDSLAP